MPTLCLQSAAASVNTTGLRSPKIKGTKPAPLLPLYYCFLLKLAPEILVFFFFPTAHHPAIFFLPAGEQELGFLGPLRVVPEQMWLPQPPPVCH